MNQTIRVILATILVALNFTHPGHADAQQKFSFQGVSYNGDIKPEQFSFSDVKIKVKSYTKRITFSAKFEDISSPYIANNQQNSFNINIDADPKTGVIYAFRLAAGAFSQTIPVHFSYSAKPNDFLIAPMSIQDGKFTSLYNQLTDHDKTMLKGACHHFKNDNNIQTLLSVKAPTGNSIVGQGTNKVSKLLSKPNIAKQIKSIATRCFDATNGTSNADTNSFTKYKLCNFVKCVDQYSFKKPSFNGAIKPEQFQFSDVMIKARSNTDRVNIKVIFQDVSTPYKSTDKDETVAITFEGDPESETVYAIRLEYGTFFQTIPGEFSFENKENRYLISTRSVEDGSFNRLYEQLTNDDKVKVKGVCHHFMDDKSIVKITSFKSPVIEGSKLKFASSERIDKIILSPNVSKQIKALATLCLEATNRVYVKDVQTFLNASGHNVGKSDGQWGKKSQSGWEAYLTSQGKPLDTTIDATSIQELQKSIISKIPKLREITFNDDYFNTKHEIRNHKEHTYGNLCKFIGCPAIIIKKNQIRKVVKDNRNKAFQNSKYIKAITKEQWNIIKNIGDPQNCFGRLSLVDKIRLGAVINPKIYAQNKSYIKQTLNKNKTVFLDNGIFQLDETINLDGKILIGSEKTILDASLLETGVIVSNGTLKNVRIINAKKIGVSVIKNSNLHNVIIENTGVGVEDNSKGHGVSILGENSTGNCLVSVEAYNGYNKAGNNCCKNGGNADGFQIKYGANGVTLVDTHGHHNSDDGFDLWKSGHDAPIKKEDIIIRFYYSSANLNGKNPLTPDGDGNGFKLGSRDKYQAPKKDKGARLIYGSVACYNKSNGFDRNGTKMKIFAGRLQATGNGAEQFRDITRYMNTPADPYTLKCKMFPRN